MAAGMQLTRHLMHEEPMSMALQIPFHPHGPTNPSPSPWSPLTYPLPPTPFSPPREMPDLLTGFAGLLLIRYPTNSRKTGHPLGLNEIREQSTATSGLIQITARYYRQLQVLRIMSQTPTRNETGLKKS